MHAASDYVARATAARLRLSMGRRGQPLDNAKAESFFRTLEMEQVYLTEYADFEDAYQQIGIFIEDVYNRKRLHSSLGYLPPEEFEENLLARQKQGSASGGRPQAPLTAVTGKSVRLRPVSDAAETGTPGRL